MISDDASLPAVPSIPALLGEWLAAASPAERDRTLERHAASLDRPLAEALWAIASAGPSYGGDREDEARLQRTLLDLAIAVAARADAPGLVARGAGLLAASGADLEEAEALWRQAAAAAELRADWPLAWQARFELARHLQTAGRGAAALQAFEAALTVCAREPRALREEAADTLEELARVAGRLGRGERAIALMREWMPRWRGVGDRLILGRACYQLGKAYMTSGQVERALAPLAEAITLLGEMAADEPLALAHLQCLQACYYAEDAEAAAGHLAELLRLRERVLEPAVLAEIDVGLGFLV